MPREFKRGAGEVIRYPVRLHLHFTSSRRDVEELLAHRCIEASREGVRQSEDANQGSRGSNHKDWSESGRTQLRPRAPSGPSEVPLPGKRSVDTADASVLTA